jgi:hypothetical protein
MPYIAPENRQDFSQIKELLEIYPIETAGEIQYLIALIIKEFMSDKPKRYATMNEVMGALNGANLEFYRRHVAPYEDECIERNGDI